MNDKGEYLAVLTDTAGREWTVYEFCVINGKSVRVNVGSGRGQYRGFNPVDRGARRRYLMKPDEARVPATHALLARQLAMSELDSRDDPAWCARTGVEPERFDRIK